MKLGESGLGASRRLLDHEQTVGGRVGVGGFGAVGPADVERLNFGSFAEAEDGRATLGGNYATFAEYLAHLLTGSGGERELGADGIAVGGVAFEPDGDAVSGREVIAHHGGWSVLVGPHEVEVTVVV